MIATSVKKWSQRPFAWLYGLCAAVTVLLLIGLLRETLFSPQLRNAQLLPEPKPLMDIFLSSSSGEVNIRQASGKWTVVFTGYTYCPDICPLELQKLAQMLKRFEEVRSPAPVAAFVSVDPERDTPQKAADYARYFHPALIGVTGRNTQLAALAQFFGVTYNRTVKIGEKEYLVEAGADMPAGSGEHYLVNHSSRMFIISPEGEYVGSFSPPYDGDILFEDMRLLMKRP